MTQDPEQALGELKTLDLRYVWKHEAGDFTPWLAEDVERLGSVLGMELELIEREVSVGDFSLDILVRDLGTGENVIVENQLTPTDHDHLGKLLTYAAGFDAVAVVWLASQLREEHRQALDWLNQRTDSKTNFFGVAVEVIQIDDSRPAVRFNLVVHPNEWQRTRRRTATQTISSRGEAYQSFFQQLIDELRERHQFTGARAGQPQSWYAFSSGITGIKYSVSFARDGRVRAEVYLDGGEAEENKRLFDRLMEDRDTIERDFGQKLEWERLDDRIASRVAICRPGSISTDDEELAELRQWSVDQMLKFKSVFAPRIRSLNG